MGLVFWELSDKVINLSSTMVTKISQLADRITIWYAEASNTVINNLSHVSMEFAPMVLWQSVLYWGLIFVMVLGVAGAFIPGVPGISLIVGAIIIWGLVKGFAGLWLALGVAIAALVLGIIIDNLAGILGAQKVGASNWGQIGGVIGMLLGLFGFLPALPVGGPILGLIMGTILGAFIGEFLYRKELTLMKRVKQSFKVGIAILVGSLVGNLLQGLLAVIPIVIFILTTWSTL